MTGLFYYNWLASY